MHETASPTTGTCANGSPITPAPRPHDRMLFEASPLPLWIYDLETLAILDVNEVACTRYGYSRDEFLAMTIRDIRPPEDVAAVEHSVRTTPPEIFNSGQWRHRLKDGTLIDVEITSHELVFQGRLTRFVCPIDVTQRVRAEHALREREAALRHAQALAGLAHAVSGPRGDFESWSESLPALVGVSADDLPRSTRAWLAFVHEDDRALFRDRSIAAARAGLRMDIAYRLRRADGRVIHLRQVIEPMPVAHAGGARRWFSTVQDVTAQKDTEAQVLKANEELERRVRERTLQLESSNRELARATAAAEHASRAKSEFLSNMSHELRTPLNAIIGFGQLLSMPEVMARDGEQRTVFVKHIVDAGRHLLSLINEILDLAQIEAGKVALRVEPVMIDDVLAECNAMMHPLATQRRVALVFPPSCDLVVRADRMRLKQVVLNLMSNAIKYNRENGEVTIDCRVVDGRARLHVCDTGKGLSTAQVDALFEAFNRLGQEGGATEGSGIGLVVSRRLVELMGGRMGVESTPGVGSVFHVDLALAAAGTSRGLARGASELAPAGPGWAANPFAAIDSHRAAGPEPALATVLCVDDDAASLRLVQRVLATLPSVQLLTASNGRLGVEMAVAHSPTVIVMDNNMPEMSGREAQAHLRADPRTAAIPVIALSANAMPGAAEAGLAAGYFRYLTKPFEVRELLRAVGDALEAARPRR